ncbi:MAG: hypothetical protein RDU83_06245 [bacterium]|nr:hypothetical protein [bacterium]
MRSVRLLVLLLALAVLLLAAAAAAGVAGPSRPGYQESSDPRETPPGVAGDAVEAE